MYDRVLLAAATMAARCRREELRLGMRLSPAGMYAVAEQAASSTALTPARALMLAGVMTRQQWHVLRTATRAVPQELLEKVLDLVLPKVPTSTTRELQRHIDRVLAKLLPDRGARARDRAQGPSGRGVARRGRPARHRRQRIVRDSTLRAVSDPTQVHRIAQLVEGHARWMRDATPRSSEPRTTTSRNGDHRPTRTTRDRSRRAARPAPTTCTPSARPPTS
ncbi:MAG: hypothetical protein ACTHQ3_21435 [Motilibacteraceae bacterium]